MIAHSIGLLRVRDRTEISPLGVFSSGRREPAPLPEFRLNYPHCIYSLIGWIAACPAEEVWWPRMGSHHRRPALQAGATTTELLGQMKMADPARFALA